MNAKAMIERNAKNETKFFYADRNEIEIVKNYSIKQKDGTDKIVHKKGQIKRPHRLVAEQLVLDGIAKYTPNSTKPGSYKRNERFGKPEKRNQ